VIAYHRFGGSSNLLNKP